MTAVRPLVVLKYLGQILLSMAALTAVTAALAALTLPLSRLPAPRQIQWNEALAVTGLTFLVSPLAMTWPLMGHGIPALDAWFDRFTLPEQLDSLEPGDEVTLIAGRKRLKALMERWTPPERRERVPAHDPEPAGDNSAPIG